MNLNQLSRRNRTALIFFFFAVWQSCVSSGGGYVRAYYEKSEYMVPMRDGVKLFTIVYTPKDKSKKYPFLLFRTIYSIKPYGPANYKEQLGPSVVFDRDGFIFVYQDVRGRYSSEGEFFVMKPHKQVKKSVKDTDESSDTYDTIEWMLKNIPNNNGNVGQWGISYAGWETTMGMIDAHPALKASSPQASPSDMWLGDDFHHNGAFRYMYTFDWLSRYARPRSATRDKAVNKDQTFNYGTADSYSFFMWLGPIANVNRRYFHYDVPTWNEYMIHGDYDKYWQRRNIAQYLDGIHHPVLNVAGWFDAEDFYGPMSIYSSIEKKNQKNKNIVVVGPWSHGGWSIDGDSLGVMKFGSKTGLYFQREVLFPFFKYYLKGQGQINLPEALVFQTGKNEWRSFDRWPPKNVAHKGLFLSHNGRLSFTAPAEAGEVFDSYMSDPAKPVPFSTESRSTQGALWMVEHQRFASCRPDVLVYQTDVLTEDLTIAGPIIARMKISTTGTDADLIVKLIDVYPPDAPDNMGEFQILIAAEVFRGKYRNSFENPEPFVPGKVATIEYDLHEKLHTFLRGHRIMVQVQSTWFPVIDRNPQKFMNIYEATEADFQKAAISIHRSALNASQIRLNVLSE